MGRLRVDAPPLLRPGEPDSLAQYTDPVPQALVLTAIVITFAMTALLLVVLLASRGFTGTDHVDGMEAGREPLLRTSHCHADRAAAGERGPDAAASTSAAAR